MKPGAKLRKLSDRHRLFIQEYLVDRIASRAAVRAGVDPKTGWKYVTQPEYRLIQDAIKVAIEEDEGRYQALKDRIVEERCRIAFADLTEALGQDGKPLPLDELPMHLRAAISEWKETQFLGQDGVPQQVRHVKLWSKNEALTALEKITGLTRDRVEHSGTLNLGQAREELHAILSALGSPQIQPGGAGCTGSEVDGGAVPPSD